MVDGPPSECFTWFPQASYKYEESSPKPTKPLRSHQDTKAKSLVHGGPWNSMFQSVLFRIQRLYLVSLRLGGQGPLIGCRTENLTTGLEGQPFTEGGRSR